MSNPNTQLIVLPGSRKFGNEHVPSFVSRAANDPNPDLQRAIKAVLSAKKVAVVVGAGISTAANIPDFRSSTGLFASLKSRFPNAKLSSGRDLFDINAWKDPDTCSLHLGMLAELHAVCEKAQPTVFHQFLKQLDEDGKLSRVYTQNIDGLEEKAGLTYGVPDPTPSRPRESRTLSSEARSRKRKRDQNELPPAPPSTPPVSVCGDHNLEDDDKNIHQHSDRAQCVTCSSQSDLSGSEMCSQASTASTLCPTQAHSSSSDKIPAALSQVKTRAAAMADAARAPSVAIQPRPVRPKPVDPFPRVIPLHGTLKHLTCSICKHSKLMSECIPALSAGELIHCSQCENFDAARTISGFRPRGVGVLKSGVVLYGEEHTEGELVGQVTSRDLMRGRRPDLLIVAGTTLKVPGTKRLVKELSKVIRPPSKEAHDSDEADDEDRLCASSKKAQPIHTIFLNNEFPTPGGLWKDTFDVWIKGDLGKFIDMVSQERIHQEELKAKRALDKIERERRKEEKLNKTAQQEKDDPSLSQTSTATTSVKLPSTPRRKKTVQTSDLPTTAKLPSIPKGKKAIKTTVPLTKVPSATTNVQKSVAKFFPISKAGTAPANIGKRSGPKLTKAPTKPKATSAAKRAPKAGAARTVAV